MLYFDYSATTPMSDYALDTYQRIARQYYANSQSLHTLGQEAEDVLAISRRTIAASLPPARPDDIYFTGSGSEATFLALTGLAIAHKAKGKTILTTEGEHHSVHQALAFLHEREGFHIRYLAVNQYGQVTEEELRSAIDEDTVLVTIGHANSEIGTVQDLAALGKILADHAILFHSDCVQTFGKLPIPLDVLTSASFSAHKCYGPKGVGAAYLQHAVGWASFHHGTTHENGFRAGTVDVPAIAAFAAAVEEMSANAHEEMSRLADYRDEFIKAFAGHAEVCFEGHPTARLPFHIALRAKGMEGQLLMLECNRKGFAISTGSACRAGQSSPSRTLISLGRSAEEAHELVRITFGKHTTKQDVTQLIKAIKEILLTYKGDE